MRARWLVIAAAVGAAGCNLSSTGGHQHLTFTPSNCGVPAGCDFADTLAVFGTADVQLGSADGTSTAGLDLVSRDPTILRVEPVAPVQGLPTWRLTGLSPGTGTLAAVDRADSEVDTFGVPVALATSIGFVKLAGTASGPNAELGYDQAWDVTADQPVSWTTNALVGGQPIMGRLAIDVTADPAGLLAHEVQGADHTTGTIYVTPPAGDYPLTLDVHGTSALRLDVVVHAK